MKFCSLQGLSDYEEVRQLQLRLVELRAQDRIEDTVLFLEHAPVITRGRGLQLTGEDRPRHMPLIQPLPAGIGYVEAERGGDLTYHGPGQLVIYPIFKLDGSGFSPFHDVEGFLRKVENVLVAELVSRGLTPRTRKKATGVWVGDKKIASMGIAIRHWVSYHGIALNAVNDLGPFRLISPCGFSGEIMTNLLECLPSSVESTDWRKEWEQSLARRFSAGF